MEKERVKLKLAGPMPSETMNMTCLRLITPEVVVRVKMTIKTIDSATMKDTAGIK